MNKRMKYYSVVWLIALLIFNVVTFVTKSNVSVFSKSDTSFWIGYSFITVAFLGQLACVYKAFKAESLQKLFYNISLISISYVGLMVMLVVGTVCMAVAQLPYWLGIIACLLVLCFTAISVVKASGAIEIVEKIDEKVKQETFFIKSLTLSANNLVAIAKDVEIKDCATAVYEAIRYSDPMRNSALANIETQISSTFDNFANAVKANNANSAKAISNELLLLISDRNQKSKLLK